MFSRKKENEQNPPAKEMTPEEAALLDRLTVNTQSSVRIGAEKVVYFDPFKIKGEPRDADVIFITHAHYDHFSPDDIEKVINADTVFVIPASMKQEMSKVGADDEHTVALGPGESARVKGIFVETLPAYNVERPFHPKKNGWLGYVITIGAVRVYVAGDTDATDEAANVKCDVAVLPIGGTYTMNPKEARSLALTLSPSAAIPTHYGSIVGSPSDYDAFAKGLGFAVRKLNC